VIRAEDTDHDGNLTSEEFAAMARRDRHFETAGTYFDAYAVAHVALADGRLTGKDAAYVDWAAKNCGLKSTDREHAMVDQADARDRDGFLRQYLEQYQSKGLADALTTPSKQEAMCKDIRACYGPLGTRIGDLLTRERSTAPPDRAATAAKKGGRRRSQQPSQQN
jgi:hypothetical protein